ncbi:MAG: bifunctional glutamate N-acetyltransferase/amino-acid acetyltransferase ArgJ [Candidatus Cyclobacteriaceae bacterium M3_2C_046]
MQKNITDVKGFKCWGSHIGIKTKRRDLAIIYSIKPASAAAVFTKNVVVAEPLKISRKHVENGVLQAFVINSGNANACTGEQGRLGAEAMAKAAAESLNVELEDVLIASTGIIGEKFPTEKVVEGIKEGVKKLTTRQLAGSLVANAILTTDTFAKEGYTSFKLKDKQINMAGIAKGSGMIHPNMGTMLGYIVSDVSIDAVLLKKALKTAVDQSFNMITVDGDTSTNDMVAIMCNGAAENKKIEKEDQDYEKFLNNLKKLCLHLAKSIVSDGEGATKLVEYKVINAPSEEDARKMVRTISDSNLVKTAIFGRDPNWGRIIAAAGRSGVDFNPEVVDLIIGTYKNVEIVKNGQPVSHDRTALKRMMRASSIKIVLDLKQGNAQAIGWGSDLSYEYVRINAEYTT